MDCSNCEAELDDDDLRNGYCSQCQQEIGEEILAATAGAFYGSSNFNLFGG